MDLKKYLLPIGGFFIGIVNVLLGAGGGLLTVPLLKKIGLSQKRAQAGAIAVILPLTVFSCLLYFSKGYIPLKSAVWFLPFGLFGAAIGTFLLRKLSGKLLQGAFGGFMLWAGIRMLMR